MNNNTYRVIFSKVTNTFIAVAETVKSNGKSKSISMGTASTKKKPSLRFATLGVLVASLFGSVTLAHAQMVAYKNGAGPRPTIDKSNNGRTVVQIVAPNAAGLSHNKYDQFNVDKDGVILNNSSGTVLTQIGGYIDGNRNLAPGTGAKIILNEVMSTNRSLLNGYIEVAGNKADVIIANPNGFSVGGLGFFNASRGVLTTGTPVFGGDGSLASFRVTKGDINIGAGGLNATSEGMSSLDLIARSVSVNDKIFANQLNVTAGANQVNYNDLGVTMIAGEGGQPTVAIDSSALGGMYAQKIMLAGNEYGVGVRLLGDVAATAGDVTISNNGQITLNNKTNATGQITINSGSDVTNTGVLYGQQVALSSAAQVNNTGTIAAQKNVNINGASITSSGVLAAGIDANGKATQAGNLTLSATGQLTASGQNIAGGNIVMTAADIDLSESNTSASGSATLSASAGDIDNSNANLQVAGNTTLNATGAVINDGGVINTGQLTSNSNSLSNVAGSILQSGTANSSITTIGAINNTSGSIATNATNLTLQSGSLQNNAGNITQAGAGALTINTAGFDNRAGNVATNGQLLLTATSLQNKAGQIVANRNAMINLAGDLQNNQGTIQTANQLQINAANIDNSAGRLVSLDTSGLSLETTGLLTNTTGKTASGADGGIIGGNGDVDITAANVNNNGNITSGQNLTANISNQLNNNNGRIAAAKAMAIQAARLSNAKGNLDAANLQANIAQLNNNNGKISADQLTINATSLSNQQGSIAQFGKEASIINVINALDNTSGIIQTNGDDFTLTSGQLINNSGQISHAGTGQFTIKTKGALQNQKGTIGSNGNVNVTAANINNQAGNLFAQGDASMTIAGDIDNSNGGYLSGNSLALNATGINNTNGKIEALKNGLAINANYVNNAAGSIQNIGSSPLTITLRNNLNNVRGFIGSSGDVDIDASSIDNTSGTMYAKDNFALNANGTLTNVEGTLQSDGTLSAIATGLVNNSGGRMEANGAAATLAVQGTSINNTSGRIANSGTGATTINGGSGINNSSGTIGGNGDVTLVANALTNNQGKVISANDLQLAIANNVNNAQGQLYAARHLAMNQAGTTLNNRAGTVSAGGDINFTFASLDNTSGQIGNLAGSGGNIGLSTSGTIYNAEGNIGSDKNLAMVANTLQGLGKVIAGQDATINLQGNYTNEVGNTISANNVLRFSTTGTLTNAGTFSAQRGLILNAWDILNVYGALINSGQTVVSAQNQLTNQGRIYGDNIALSAANLLNDNDAAIAARNNLQIGATNITNHNHALLTSLGDIAIGGALDANYMATGLANVVTNSQATMDAGGNFVINANTLNNLNPTFRTERVQLPDKLVVRYSIDNGATWYTEEQGASVTGTNDKSKYYFLVNLPNGTKSSEFIMERYKEKKTQDQVVATDPGQIYANGKMLLNVGHVNNYASAIVGSLGLGGAGVEIENDAPIGKTTTWELGIPDSGGDGHILQYGVGTHTVEGSRTRWIGFDAINRPGPVKDDKLSIWLGDVKPDRLKNPALDNKSGSNDVPGGSKSNLGNNESGKKVSGDGKAVDSADGSAGGNTGVEGNNQTVTKPGAALPNLALPSNQLYIIQPAPGKPLIETDPAFTNYQKFVSSDYLLNRLGINPQTTQKRLGDGYYEQKLILDQITQLTGTRLLGDFTTNEAQYEALMNNGATVAKEFQLTPGIALSAEQMASLTSDMVWLVNQTVTLPDGSNQQVLVPVVYLASANALDVRPSGAIISTGGDMNLAYNNVQNSGTLQGNNSLIVNATNITNSGNMMASGKNGQVVLAAQNDITSSGTISGNRVGMVAGNNVTIASEIGRNTGTTGHHAGIAQVATINADQLSIQSGRDINLNAANIQTTGDAALVAGNNLNIGTVTTDKAVRMDLGSKGHNNTTETVTVGSNLTSGGNLTLAAGQDMNVTASYINSDKQITAAAGRDININAGQQTNTHDIAIHHESSGFLSSSSTDIIDKGTSKKAIASTISGDKVTMVAGNNLNITGSNVVATNDMALAASNNVNIIASQNTSSNYYDKQESKSGLFAASGGIGVTLGTQEQQNTQTSQSLTHNASTVGSLNGNVTIQAGNAYTQTGSNVMSLQGDTSVIAKTIDINTVTDIHSGTEDSRFKQSGITLAVSAPIIAAAQTVSSMASATSQTDDPRMKLMGAAVAGKALYDGKGLIEGALQNPDDLSKSLTNQMTISLTVGSSESESHSEYTSNTIQGSNISAGGNVNLIATGAGKDSHINVIGSNIDAGNNIALISDGNINLEAAKNSSTQNSSSSSSSAAIGVAATLGPKGTTFGVTANASASRGDGNGSDTSYTHTNINAGKQLIIASGGDTTLKGATATAEQIIGQIGGNLNLESLQDTSNYNSKDQNIGGSITVGLGTSTVSGSINYGQTKVNGDYQSVTQQTGLLAGDGGFQIVVGGNTDLKGAVIASNENAIKENKNTFITDTLTQSDLQNHSNYEADSVGIGLSANKGASETPQGADSDKKQQENFTGGPSGNSAGYASESGSSKSTTNSGISGNANGGGIAIINDAAQQALTGNTAAETIASINKDITTETGSNGLKKDWDAQDLKNQVNAGAQITAAFGSMAAKEIGTYATKKYDELINTNPEEAKKWAEGGAYRVALHTATGALTGGIQGAAGALTSATAMPVIGGMIEGMGLPTEVAKGLNKVTAGVLGAIVGGESGMASGINVEANNRQLHQTEKQRIKDLANGDPTKEARLTAAACAAVKCYAEYQVDSPAYQQLKQLADIGNSPELAGERQLLANQSGLFSYTNNGLFSDSNLDAAKQLNNTYKIVDRGIGAGQLVLGELGLVGSIVTAPFSCATGIGCVANGLVGTISADTAYAGAQQLVFGDPTNTFLNQGLQGLGLSPEAAGLVEFALGSGGAATAGSAFNKALDKAAALNGAARGTYGAGGKGESQELGAIFSDKQLDKKFKHAEDFGLSSTKKNPETLAQYQNALESHLNNSTTYQHGTYQYVPNSTVHFNSSTNNVVVLSETGEFVTGWKLSPGTPQFENYLKNGVLR